MKLNSQDLDKIADVTLDFYNRHAEDFWEGTRDHDVSQNITAILQHIEAERPFIILDFGCGPGRDLKVFTELGHIAIGFRDLAALFNFRGFCSTDPVLPSCRPATRKTALAGDHMASVSAPIAVRARCQSRHDGDIGQCPLTAQSGAPSRAQRCPLLG